MVVREPGRHALVDALDALGVPVHYCPGHPHPLAFGRAFLRLLRTGPRFTAVHSHLDRFTGLIMLLARFGRVPVRIAHMHNDYSRDDQAGGWRACGYAGVVRGLVQQHATAGIGVSGAAADYLFGRGWPGDPRWRVLPCGIDPQPLRRRTPDPVLRAACGIPADAWVVGAVGRLAPQKNHALLIEALPHLRRLVPGVRLVIAGTGPLADSLRARATALGVADVLVLAGARDDIPALLTGVFDAFAFPSWFEGMPLAVVEAQAAGLPCVVSAAVPASAIVARTGVVRCAPDAAPVVWAAAIAGCRTAVTDHAAAWQGVADGPLAIGHGVRVLEELYARR